MTTRDKDRGLTLARLRELLHYNPRTGVWTWRQTRSRLALAGSVAGNLHSSGYIIIGIEGRDYRAHRLAWFYMTGEWPTDQVDHHDLNRSNNRWRNLRPATGSENGGNRRPYRNNQSGFKGIYWHKEARLWHARITPRRRAISLGYFYSPVEAHAAYARACVRYFGEFGRAA